MSGIRTGQAVGITTRPPRALEHGAVVYQLSTGGHRQRGVVVEVSVDDYRAGRIRMHEATDPARVECLEGLLETAPMERVPVTLFHPTRPALRALLADATSGEPAEVHPSDGDRSEAVWVEGNADRAQAIQHELAGIDVLYIADGHHRMSAAEHHAARSPSADRFVLAALFPADEMRVLGYHRCLARPEESSTSELLEKLARLPATAWIAQCASAEELQPAPGVIGVHLDGQWYRLGLAEPKSGDARAALDIVALEDRLLAPLLATSDITSDARVTAVPGSAEPPEVARRCAEHRAIGFLLHPPSVAQIMAVADAGLVMPPKSTWFDPKPAAGLLGAEPQ